ncbi:MAG: suppressor of fused domain protein [Peptococcaceae bacterium]|jgi:hypothetical protein|nr:suppressor of fused domain protein [Peptococcaceae bacterium]
MEQKVTVSKENKEIAQYVTNKVGFNTTVQRYKDESNENYLDIYASDTSDEDVKFYGTIGLSDYPNIIEINGEDTNVPVELLMAGNKTYDKIPSILATCGFNMAKEKWICQPGAVFLHMIDLYYEKEMRHLLFIPPYKWNSSLEPLELADKTVNWLLAVPISEPELQYRLEHGFNALSLLFEENSVDMFDWDRKSMLAV